MFRLSSGSRALPCVEFTAENAGDAEKYCRGHCRPAYQRGTDIDSDCVPGMSRAFLTAEWRNLVMLNYVVDPTVLAPLVPAGTILDHWQGRTYVSLVGFLFANTRLLGVPIPYHRTFEEVNLRFYVRRAAAGELRRGVTFIKELVPRTAIAGVARMTYNEPYESVRMRHSFGTLGESGVPTSVHYGWRSANHWNGIEVAPRGLGRRPDHDSEAQFITEHYWGYTRQRDGSTVEYRVSHEPWRVWDVAAPTVIGDWTATYGAAWSRILATPPSSTLLVDGSPVTVYVPRKLSGVAAPPPARHGAV